MKSNLFILLVFSCLIIEKMNAQVTPDPSYTPKLFINANLLEYKMGGLFDGFTMGLDPVYNLNNRVKINGWFDFPVLDGKIDLKDISDNQNDIRNYRKTGAGVIFTLFESEHTNPDVKFILSIHDEGNHRITRFVEEEVPFKRQLGIRAGIEHYRFIAEPTKVNANGYFDDIAYLVTPSQQIIWYEGITNWRMNCFYAGLSRNDVYSAKVKNSYGEGIMARYMDWYFDFLLPVTIRVDDINLNGKKIPVKDAFKKNTWGWRFGVTTVGMIYAKIETGLLPGIKSGWFFNSAIGYTFKALK